MSPNLVTFVIVSLMSILVFRFILVPILKAIRQSDIVKNLRKERDDLFKECTKLEKDLDKLKKEFDFYKAKTEKGELFSAAKIAEERLASYKDFVFYGCLSDNHVPLFELEEAGLVPMVLDRFPKSIIYPKGAKLNDGTRIYTYVQDRKSESGDTIYRPPEVTVHNGKGHKSYTLPEKSEPINIGGMTEEKRRRLEELRKKRGQDQRRVS